MSFELGLRCVPEILRFALDDNPGFQRGTPRPYFVPLLVGDVLS